MPITRISLTVSLAGQSEFGIAKQGLRVTLDANGPGFVSQQQVIGTAAEAIFYGDCTGQGVLTYLKNLDPLNFVTLYQDGAAGTKQACKLLPNQAAILFSPSTGPALGAKANTAACRLETFIIGGALTPVQVTPFEPALPGFNRQSAKIGISATVGGASFGIDHEYTGAIVETGQLLQAVSDDGGGSRVWTSVLGAGNECSHILMTSLYEDSGNGTTLFQAAGASPFAWFDSFHGFCLLPLNAATFPFKVGDATAFSMNQGRVITAKVIGAPEA